MTFELADAGQNYVDVVRKIQSLGGYARVNLFTYMVATELTPVQVRDTVKAALRPSDKVFVGTCPPPAAWEGEPDEVSKWILENQPKYM